MKLHQILKLFAQSRDSGFTIIESLVAIIVTAILLTAIAPVLVISTATRVQARRIELATQAAKTYIDGVQTKTITTLPAITTDTIDQFAVPTGGSLTCSANSYCSAPATPTNNLYCVDRDAVSGCASSSSQDLIIQVFRKGGSTENYQLGLRVYRADAFRDSVVLKKNAPTKVTQSPFTGGIGDRKAPLLEITTEINTGQPAYSNLCSRLGGCS